MQRLGWLGAALVGLASFVAAVLNIIDYFLHQPDVIATALGPFNVAYQQWIQAPYAAVTKFVADVFGARLDQVVLPISLGIMIMGAAAFISAIRRTLSRRSFRRETERKIREFQR